MSRKETAKIASDIKIASDNTVKNSIINYELDFSGLKDVVALFFPSIRDEMILRYRAETIAKIGAEAYKIARNENIRINPIPPKIALPLIEKMSLEHEADMYEKWAKLLIAAGVKSNPIHQQYADILANINNENAKLLKAIYEKQSSSDIEKEYEKDINISVFKQCYDDIRQHTSHYSTIYGKHEDSLPDSFGAIHSYFQYPLILQGTEKSMGDSTFYDKTTKVLVFTEEDKNDLIGLEKLGLIKHQYLYDEHEYEDGQAVYIKQCGVLLTQFGYSFVDCLEHPTK